MLEYRLIKLMQVLQSKELLDMEKYLAVPFINSNDDVSRLFAQLCKFHPGFDHPKLTKERLHQKLYGKQAYNDGKMRKLMMLLSQTIEQYLMQKELKKSEELQAKLLSMSLRDRSNYELFLQTVDTRLKKLEKGTNRGRDYFRESYELNEMVYFHPETGKLSYRNAYFAKAIENLERHFTLVSLQAEANNVIINRMVRDHTSGSYLEKVQEVAQVQGFSSFKTILFFHHIVVLLKQQSDEDLYQLKKHALETFNELSRFEQDFALNLLRGYSIPKANSGSLSHARFIFDLFKLELDRGFIADTITAGAFMNIVTLGLAVGDFIWIDNFLSEFNQFLPKDEREITLNYCQGLLSYHKGLKTNVMAHFFDAIQYINLIPIRAGMKFEIRLRPTLLRIHFELFSRKSETLEELFGHAKNFERHLNGSGLYSEAVRVSNINFLRWFRSLARLVSSPNLNEDMINDFLYKLSLEKGNVVLKHWIEARAKGLVSKN